MDIVRRPALLAAHLFTNERDQQARSRFPDSQNGYATVRNAET
jgi:hypothetical protein